MSIGISVIVPCFNESEVIRETNDRLLSILSRTGVAFELIYIDDGSKDDTLSILESIQNANSSIKVLTLSRNFGHQAAVSAGLRYTRGDAVVVIDADLQDPPELIVDMIAKWKEGYEVVFAQRERRLGESHFKIITSKIFSRLMKYLTDFEIPMDTGDFVLMDRSVVDILIQLPEHHKFMRGLVAWVGFKRIGIKYIRHPRFAGTTKYSLKKMISLARDAVFSFSTRPLLVALYLGALTMMAATVGLCYAFSQYVFKDTAIEGWIFFSFVIMFFSGLQLLSLGVIGQYLGMIFAESKNRPNFIVAKTFGYETQSTKTEADPSQRRAS